LKMANQLLPAWGKVKTEQINDLQITSSETQLLERMEEVFNQHVEWVNRKVGLS
jgi:hypothetical protein